MKNNKKLDDLLQTSPLEEGTCNTIQNLTLAQVNQMLLELELDRAALELRLWKAGTRASRKRLTRPLIEIVQTITLLSCLKQKQLSTE